MFKKNTAVTGFQIGHFIGVADGIAVTTGTPVCKRLLEGVAGTLTNAAAYDATAGVWKIDLAADDMNGDMVGLSFTLTACLPISYAIKTDTKLVSDLRDAVSGLTAQETRDALLLAPSAGAPADGSIDDHLDDLAATLAAATTELTLVSAVDVDVITVYQAVSFSATITGLAIPAAWTKVWFTVKADAAQADTAAIIQIVESNPGVGTDGLLRINGAAGTAANGTLTVSQATGTVVIDLVDETTDDLALATGLLWSLKALATGGATTLLAVGTLNVLGQATMTIA